MSRKAPLIWLGVIVLLVAGVTFIMSRQRPGQVVRVTDANPELQAAITEARRGLPGFVAEMEAAKPDTRFAVKAGFPTQAGMEYLWIKDPSFRDGKFTGILDQKPMIWKGGAEGSEVTVAKADVVDWLIMAGTNVRGRFTEDVLARQNAH